MRTRFFVAALAVVPLVISATAGGAAADLVTNNLDASVDATAEIMPLNVGGPPGTTQLSITKTGDDGKSGCNLTGQTTLVVDVSSSAPAVAAVTPSRLTFSSCGDVKTLTVNPGNQGSSTVSLSQVSNNTGGSFDLAPATFTVNVTAPAPANTAPSVSVSGVASGDSYAKGFVPTATCQVVDAEDGNSSFPATLSAVTGDYASDGIGSQTASCSYTDKGGLTASGSASYGIYDPTAPAVSYTLNPADPDGSNGWYTGNVALTWKVTEPESPLSLTTTGCADQNITSDQVPTAYSCSATSAGGTTGPSIVSIKRDGTAPAVAFDHATGTVGNDGWYTSPVTAYFSATDATSGLAAGTDTQSVTSTEDGESVSLASPVFTDLAGNTAGAGAASQTFKIDTQAPNAPTYTLDPAPTNGWNTSDVTVHFSSAGDNGPSGIAGCTQDVVVDTEGANQDVTGYCWDNAGNTSDPATVTVNLDKSAPTVSYAGVVEGTEGADGWYTSDVTARFTATDDVSGPSTQSQTVISVGEGESVEVDSPQFTDAAGNASPAGAVTHTFKIDKTAPTDIQFHGMTDGSSYYYGATLPVPTCTASDNVSGVTCVVTGDDDPRSVGQHSYTATATNGAGLASTSTLGYTVKAWTLKGFYAPVDMGNVWNTVKGGSTVPLKFEMFSDHELTDTSAVQDFTVKGISCPNSNAVTDNIELTTTGGTSLRYDATAGQFIQNWQTPKKPGACYAVTMTTRDGSQLTARFALK